MIKYKKREMVEAINMLLNVNEFVVKNCMVNKKEDIIKTLAQCQDVAIELGNYLETLENGEFFVHILEDYCENLYQLSCNLSDKNTYRKLSKQIQKQLSSLKSDIIKVVPDDKIEMVFLPYKASMWDSLESVWRAAEEDPDCDAYVVPIPYFEKNSSGELAIEHYEGGQFPEDVPVVHYTDYNMEEHRPDVVFIHNPYDQYNYVTSIHPAYYISELKKYADKVAYIPYYVSSEINLDAPEVQKQKEGFVLTQGVLYSDFVFVQSESMKRLYVNVLEKNISGVGREYWENKIFGLGSPKMDRVHSVKRDDSRLPLKWRSLIFDETGKRKKVILYNISIADLLNHENMMDKIADTLAFFEKNRDCVLWWRPHPLYESTIISMRPNLLEVYHQMIEQYKAGGWGIFDEGEDLNWAIAETDAYYGDGSSVVQLYLEAGKPVLYQDTRVKNVVETDVNIPIWPCAFCVDGEDIWFVHGKMSLLMKYCMRTDSLEIVELIPGNYFFQESLYQSIYKDKDKIYLIPCWARKIVIYDVENRTFESIQLNEIEDYDNVTLFCKCIMVENNLYCIPTYYNSIVKLELETRKITYIKLPIHMEQGKKTFLGDGILIDSKIICPWNISNQLLILELESEKTKLLTIGKEKEQYANIGKLDKEIVLYDNALKNIVIVSLLDERKKIIHIQQNESFVMSTIADKLIMLDDIHSSKLICINSLGKFIYKSYNNGYRKKYVLEYTYYHGILHDANDKMYYFDRSKQILFMFDLDNKKKKQYFEKLKININQLWNLYLKTTSIIQTENELLLLPNWIFQNSDSDKSIKKTGYENKGEMIKTFVKDNI